jgi:hypothetical protein
MQDADRDLDDARELYRELRDLFAAHVPGRADEYALEEARRLCTLASLALADAHYQRQLRQLERYASYFFSGDDRRRSITLDLLAALGRRLENLEVRRYASKVLEAARVTRSRQARRRFAYASPLRI